MSHTEKMPEQHIQIKKFAFLQKQCKFLLVLTYLLPLFKSSLNRQALLEYVYICTLNGCTLKVKSD